MVCCHFHGATNRFTSLMTSLANLPSAVYPKVSPAVDLRRSFLRHLHHLFLHIATSTEPDPSKLNHSHLFAMSEGHHMLLRNRRLTEVSCSVSLIPTG